MSVEKHFNRIVFYFPCHVTGGGQYLFIRYAEAMALNYPHIEVFFVDYIDGFARQQLKSTSHVKFIDYNERVKTVIPSNSVVVHALNHLKHFREQMVFDESNTSFIFWCIAFHDLYIPKYLISKHTRKAIGEELIWLTQNGIIRYLGPRALDAIARQYGISPIPIEPIPLVVPTDKYSISDKEKKEIGNVVRFCWLGRLDDDKLNDILTYMNELEVYNRKRNVCLSLIGRGNAEKTLRSVSYTYPINFVGEMRDQVLDKYIKNHVDIGLASGTSSLEFAFRKVPVVHGTKLAKVFNAGEYSGFRYIEQIESFANFETICNGILFDYSSKCEAAYSYAMSKSPSAGAKKMRDAMLQLERLNVNEVFSHISRMSDLLAVGAKRYEKLKLLRKIMKTFRKK